MSLRDDLLASRQAKTLTITPEFLGKPVEIIMLTVRARRDLLKASKDASGKEDPAALQAAIAIATVRDPETKEMAFTLADKKALMEWPACDLDELTNPAMELNGFSAAAKEAAVKNSETTPSE